MMGKKILFVLCSVLLAATVFGQVPTPCGTPIANTCLSYGAGFIEVIDVGGWSGSDGVVFLVDPPEDQYAVNLKQLEVAMVPKGGALSSDIVLVSVYEIGAPGLLPDIEKAGTPKLLRYPFVVTVTTTPPQLLWVVFDLTGAGDIICNRGPIAIKLEYDYYESIVDFDFVTDQPSCTFVPASNIHYDFAGDNYEYLENHSISDGNWTILARYYSNAPFEVPALGVAGLVILLTGVTALLVPRRKK